MKVVVIIPCHIQNTEQFLCLCDCIISLIKQSYSCSIYLSISFSSEELLHFFNESIFPLFKSRVVFFIQSKQTFQMIHIYKVFENIKDFDLIMFCDDDDQYTLNRVEHFVKFKTENSNIHIIQENIPKHSEISEYWCYGISYDVLNDFFDKSKNYMDLLENKFADIYFRNYLIYNQRFSDIVKFTTKTPSYIYSPKPNSITLTIQKKRLVYERSGKIDLQEVYNQMTFAIIENNYIKLKLLIDKIKISEEEFLKIIPFDKIKSFTNCLYN